MSNDVVITVENLSKRYRLGQIGATSLRESAEHWWHKVRGRNPHVEMGEVGLASPTTGCGLQTTKDDLNDHACVVAGLNDSDDLNDPQYVWALNDVSFEVKRGEVLGVIGKNGAGKSTLLKILSRITEPTSGRAVLRGRVGSLLEVGTGFHPELTGRENIFLNGAILGMKKREVIAKFDEIVDFAEVEKFIDTPVKRYSSGMYVRLAFAVAAHLEPEILVVDEVLAVGDISFQKKCLGKMSNIAKQGRTVLFVSHNMGAIKRLCGNSLLLAGGGRACLSETTETVALYMQGNDSKTAFKAWSLAVAPGNSDIRLLKVSLTQGKTIDVSSIDITKPFNVVMEMQILRPIEELTSSFMLLAADGEVLLHAGDVASSDVAKTTGNVRVECCLPAYTLNAGIYRLSFFADEPNKCIVFAEQNVVGFSVDASCSSMGRYAGPWRGVIGPGLGKWLVFRE